MMHCLSGFPTDIPEQLQVFSPVLFNFLLEILQTDLVNNLLLLAIDYRIAIPEFFSNIYLANLSESIQGLHYLAAT